MRALIIITLIAGLGGAACLAVASRIPSYIDEKGFLIEPFGWMALGKILVVASIVAAIIGASIWAFRRLRR